MQRYTDAELLYLLHDIESDLVERKESFRGDVPKKARQAICAFANDLPNHNKAGVLFIGAKDNGHPSHEPITDELLRTLADIRSDGNILPLPVLTVEKKILNLANMTVVTVQPSDTPPVKFDGRIWIRTGPRRAIANEQEERILIEKRRFKNLPYDLYPIPTATIADLSRLVFEQEYLPASFSADILEANNRTYEERLASCRMIVAPETPTPTLSGILILGTMPRDFIPGAYIQFLRINGTELADDVIDEEKIDGNISTMLNQLGQKIKSHNRISVDIVSNAKEIRTATYPNTAIYQMVYNAVMHRTYEGTNAPVKLYWFNDRIEIYSPGGPYGNVTCENFGRPGITDYRNPNLSEAMKVLGYVQRFGRGIAIAQREMEKNGNPMPEFQVTPDIILCILRGNQ